MTTPTRQTADSNETEWQFEADDLERVEGWLLRQPATAALRFVPVKDAVQRDSYLDTDAWDVHRARFSLRVRRRPGQTEATLKALGSAKGALQTRREISQGLTDAEHDVAHAEGPVSQRLRLLCGTRQLRTLFDVETRRRTFRADENGVAIAELALDESRIEQAGQLAGEVKRVEVECIGESSGSPLLHSFVIALAEAMDLRPAEASKFQTGLNLLGLQPEPLLSFEKASPSPEDDAAEFALGVLRRFFAEMVSHEPGTRLGEDPEELHDMRVAVRRLRAALSMFREALPLEFREIRDELGWLGRVLGEVRDPDVQLGAFQERRKGAPWAESNAVGELMLVLEASREAARLTLIETLESERYGALLLRMESALSAGAESLSLGVPAHQFVAPILRERYRKFKEDADKLTAESEPPSFHAVRILGKRLRYSVEFSRPVYGRPAERLAGAVADVQDLLGQYQDASVAIDWLRSLARDQGGTLAPDTLLFMGELVGEHRNQQADLREAWQDAFGKVQDRWRRLRKGIDREESEPDSELAEPPEDTNAAANPRRFAGGPLALLRRRRHTRHT